MAYALVGTIGAASQGAAAAAVTPAYGQSPTANNLLVCYVATAFTTTLPGTPAGWTLGPQVAGTLCTATLFYKIAAGADAQPTIAGMTSTVIAAQLGEFSGNATTSPLDRSSTAAAATTPIVATNGGADVAAGELVIGAASVRLSLGGLETSTHTLNNGATSHETKNDANSSANHYNFTYGITTGKASADSDSFAFTVTNINGAALAFASFQLAPVVAPAVAYTPRRLPRQLGPRAVGPTFFAALQPPHLPRFTDAVTGQIIFGGVSADAKTGANAVTGAIIFGGAPTESKTVSDSRSGTIIFGGAPTEAAIFSVLPSGTIIFGGAPTEAYTSSRPFVNRYLPFTLGPRTPLYFARFRPAPSPAAGVAQNLFTDAVTGAIIFGGASSDARIGTDARTGAIIFGGVPGDAKIGSDSRTGAIIFGGSNAEARTGADSVTGAIIFGGTVADAKTGSDVRSGAIIFGGTVTPVTIYRVSPTGAIIFGGSAGEGRAPDTPIGTIVFGGGIAEVFIPPKYPRQFFRNAANHNYW